MKIRKLSREEFLLKEIDDLETRIQESYFWQVVMCLCFAAGSFMTCVEFWENRKLLMIFLLVLELVIFGGLFFVFGTKRKEDKESLGYIK